MQHAGDEYTRKGKRHCPSPKSVKTTELKDKRKVNKQTIEKGKRIKDALAAISTAALVEQGEGTSDAC